MIEINTNLYENERNFQLIFIFCDKIDVVILEKSSILRQNLVNLQINTNLFEHERNFQLLFIFCDKIDVVILCFLSNTNY